MPCLGQGRALTLALARSQAFERSVERASKSYVAGMLRLRLPEGSNIGLITRDACL